MLYLTKSYVLHALHNLHNPNWSDLENLRVFGKCYRLHGHNFQFEITIKGEVSPHTGFIIHPDTLDTLIDESLIQPYQGRNLNELLSNPSGEGLVIAFYEILKKELGAALHCVGLKETLKNYFRYPPTEAILY